MPNTRPESRTSVLDNFGRSERDHLVGLLGPFGELVECGTERLRDEELAPCAPRIQTGPATSHFSATSRHDLDLAIQPLAAVRNLLARHGTGHRVAHRKDPNLVAFSFGQRAGDAKSVVRAFGAMSGVVPHEEHLAF